MESTPHSNYRADIDGLRAIAVLSVVGFHAFPGIVRGGFIGVDIFFVISGYLISTIIYVNLELGRFSLKDFYIRRIRRIFPALLVILALSIAFGWFILLADEYQQLGLHVAAGAGFASNFVLWSSSGYFDSQAAAKPLLHLWSLAIEEQFYLIWPLLLLLLHRQRWNALRLTVLISLLSFAFNVSYVSRDPIATFYSPLTRIWELMVGSILAYMTLHRPLLIGRYKGTQSALGAALLALGLASINQSSTFPGWWAILPVMGAALLISAGPATWWNQTILGNRMLVWTGLISYPIYLWHWPLLSFAHILEGTEPSRAFRVMACIASIFLAWLTYKFVEVPIRFGRYASAKASGLFVATLLIGGLGYFTYANNGLTNRNFAVLTNPISQARGDTKAPDPKYSEGHISLEQGKLNGNEPATVLFIGDSLMNQYFPRAAAIYSNASALPRYSTQFLARPGCRPVPDGLDINSNGRNCDAFYRSVLDLAKSPIYTKIVVSANWDLIFSEPAYSKNIARLITDFSELRSLGKEIILISMAPHSDRFNPLSLASALRFSQLYEIRDYPDDQWIPRPDLEKYRLPTWSRLFAFAERVGATLIDPYDYLCTTTRCPTMLNRQPLYTDDYHLRASTAVKYATFIDNLVRGP